MTYPSSPSRESNTGAPSSRSAAPFETLVDFYYDWAERIIDGLTRGGETYGYFGNWFLIRYTPQDGFTLSLPKADVDETRPPLEAEKRQQVKISRHTATVLVAMAIAYQASAKEAY